ncbi:multiple epidermal growth factor-like domains protein 10 [Haliotis cracherodii]|uniref:multiple epidermal growth factor-like domains protein 10 n=1 Tax=Haliotis cracherodii TaxID=6455 RepID=UPI0039E8A823
MRLLVLTLTVLFEISSGTDLCSISETVVACHPCSVMCPGREEMCFRCPDGCGGDCSSTCGDRCLNGACHYTDAAQLQCSQGCKEGWAGISCQEGCPPNCALCDQFNSTCLSCVEGYQGDRCTHITPTEAEHSPGTGTPTSEHETTQGETESTESTITATSSVNCVKEDRATGATSNRSEDRNLRLNCSDQSDSRTTDLYPSSLWQGINIGIGLAVAVVLLLICGAIGYKLYKVHGSLKRARRNQLPNTTVCHEARDLGQQVQGDTEVAIDQPVPARPVQVAIVDDDRESGIYSYVVVKENC